MRPAPKGGGIPGREAEKLTTSASIAKAPPIEMAEDIQAYVRTHWSEVTEANLNTLTDFSGYRRAFLNMHGFDMEGVDYEAEQIVDVAIPLEAAG